MTNNIFLCGAWIAIGESPTDGQRLLISEVAGYWLGREHQTWVVLRGGEKLSFAGDLVGGFDAVLSLHWTDDPTYTSRPDPRTLDTHRF